jgi:hypothetical protein
VWCVVNNIHHFSSKNMASQSTGIQQLLAAEKKSAEKVAEARKRKFVNVRRRALDQLSWP